MDFEPYFKVHNLVSVHPKSIILGQMTNLNMIFHVVVSVYRLVNIWNSPQFPDEFRNGLYIVSDTNNFFKFDLDKAELLIKISTKFLGMVTIRNIEKTTVYFQFSLFIQISAI